MYDEGQKQAAKPRRLRGLKGKWYLEGRSMAGYSYAPPSPDVQTPPSRNDFIRDDDDLQRSFQWIMSNVKDHSAAQAILQTYSTRLCVMRLEPG